MSNGNSVAPPQPRHRAQPPIWDWNGEIRFTISLLGTRTTLQTDRKSAHVQALLESAASATASLGGTTKL
jgi:DNA-binding IclR family transcriptional regulator